MVAFLSQGTNHNLYRRWNIPCATSRIDGFVRKTEDVGTANRKVCPIPVLRRLDLRTPQVRTSSWRNKKHNKRCRVGTQVVKWTLTTMTTGNLRLSGVTRATRATLAILATPVTLVIVIWRFLALSLQVASQSVLAIHQSPVTLPNMPFLHNSRDIHQVSNRTMVEQSENPGPSAAATRLLHQPSAGLLSLEATVHPADILLPGRVHRYLSQYQLLMTQGQGI